MTKCIAELTCCDCRQTTKIECDVDSKGNISPTEPLQCKDCDEHTPCEMQITYIEEAE